MTGTNNMKKYIIILFLFGANLNAQTSSFTLILDSLRNDITLSMELSDIDWTALMSKYVEVGLFTENPAFYQVVLPVEEYYNDPTLIYNKVLPVSNSYRPPRNFRFDANTREFVLPDSVVAEFWRISKLTRELTVFPRIHKKNPQMAFLTALYGGKSYPDSLAERLQFVRNNRGKIRSRKDAEQLYKNRHED